MSRMESHSKLELSENRFGELDCTVLATTLPSVRPPRFCVILCHGFGAPGTDLVALGPDLAAMCPEASGGRAFRLSARAIGSGDVWSAGRSSLVDDRHRDDFNEQSTTRKKWPVFVAGVPEGMPESSQPHAGAVVRSSSGDLEIPPARTLLGGFSQGSMVATDVALRLSEPPAGLCVFSGHVGCRRRMASPWRKNEGRYPSCKVTATLTRSCRMPAPSALRKLFQGAGLEVDFSHSTAPTRSPMRLSNVWPS